MGFANTMGTKQKQNKDDILVGDGDISSSSSDSPKKNAKMGLQRMNVKKEKEYDRAESMIREEEKALAGPSR